MERYRVYLLSECGCIFSYIETTQAKKVDNDEIKTSLGLREFTDYPRGLFVIGWFFNMCFTRHS